jgi:transcriptional regulator with GAF, ATPase, and Fis domain
MARNKVEPKSLLEKAYSLRSEANDLEAKAIQMALEHCDWFEAPAARLLGLTRSTLKQLLLTRHKSIGEEAAQRRKEAGYKAGNPHLTTK